jgi:AmmeMemoRadiSam system protein A
MSKPEPNSESSTGLTPDQRNTLLALARQSIAHGLDQSRALTVNPDDYEPALRARRAAFVTLHEQGQLRGCIGHLEAVQTLVQDVAENAFAAAFRDPRFPPLATTELDALAIEISVLTPAVPMEFSSEQDLIGQIRQGIDGLILEDGNARGTFLPSVWESLQEPAEFLRHLKRKAGLPANHWSENLRVSRYRTESFGESGGR